MKQRIAHIAKARSQPFDFFGREGRIRARGNDDRVLAAGVNADQRDSGSFALHGSDCRNIDPSGCQTCLQVIGENVVPDTAKHPDVGSACEFAGGARLIRALSSRDHLKRFAQYRFSGRGQMFRPDGEVHVQTAEDNDCGLHRGFHRVRSMPSFFSSSA